MPRPIVRSSLNGLEQLESRLLFATATGSVLRSDTGHQYIVLAADDGQSGLTWTEAEAAAVALGGHLATVHDHRELNWINQAFESTNLWIGLSDRLQEGTFTWTSESPSTFRHWDSSEPSNDREDSDYVALSESLPSGYLFKALTNSDQVGGQPVFGLVEIDYDVRPSYNDEEPRDVNSSSLITSTDAVIVINHLNTEGPGVLTSPSLGGTESQFAIDVTGNGLVTALDALRVINYLNAPVLYPPVITEPQPYRPLFSMESTTIKEGTLFYVDVAQAMTDQPTQALLRRGNDLIMTYDQLEFTSDGRIRLVMPDLPGPTSYPATGYTLAIQNGPFKADFPVTIIEGLRMTVGVSQAVEGSRLPFQIRNGIGRSEVVVELLHDNGRVVQTHRTETDEFGNRDSDFALERYLLTYDATVDGYKVRLSHAGKSLTYSLTIKASLQMWTSFENIREGDTLVVGIRNAVGVTAVHAWVQTMKAKTRLTSEANPPQTNGSGFLSLELTMADNVVFEDTSDAATLIVETTNSVPRQVETFEFAIRVHKRNEPPPPPFEKPPREGDNVVHPPQLVDNSFAGLGTQAARGVPGQDLKEKVDPDIGNDPLFLHYLNEISRERGLFSWLKNWIVPAPNAPEVKVFYRPLTPQVWGEVKDFLARLFGHNSDMTTARQDCDDFVRQIPGIMQQIGWTESARLQNKWFDDKEKNDATVSMDWILSHFRALAVFTYARDGRNWMTPNAQIALGSIVAEKLRGDADGKVDFGDFSKRGDELHAQHTQHVRMHIPDLLSPDDLDGSLSRFSFYIVPKGNARRSGPDVMVTITDIAIYAYDKYNFNDAIQPLGFWSDDGFSPLPSPGYTGVTNKTYRDYKDCTGNGYDFDIYSDPRFFHLGSSDQFTFRLVNA